MIEIANLIVSSLILLLMIAVGFAAVIANRRKKAAMTQLAGTLAARKRRGEKVSIADLLNNPTSAYTDAGKPPQQ